jgi:hypothetical protein
MDLITLRKNLTSDNVPKEDRIAALHKLEFLLRSTANLGTGRLREDSKSKRTSLSAHGRPTSSYPFEDPSRDSMASLISRSGYDDEEKIPIGTPVSKFRKERVGRSLFERNEERARYAAVQPRPQRQAETIARLSSTSTRNVAPHVIPSRSLAPKHVPISERDDFQSGTGTSEGDLLAFLAAQALDLAPSSNDNPSFSYVEAIDRKVADLNKIVASSPPKIEYQTWTKKDDPPSSPHHENIKVSTSRLEQKRKPFTFHVERQLQEPAVVIKSTSIRSTTAAKMTTKPETFFNNPHVHKQGVSTHDHKIDNLRHARKSGSMPSSSVAPFTFHRDRSAMQDENTSLLDAPLLIRANDWQAKLRPDTSSASSAFDSKAYLQSSFVESDLKTEDFLVPKGGGIPKRYKNVPSKIADHVRAVRREKFRNNAEIVSALDNVTISVPPARIPNNQAVVSQLEIQADIHGTVDVSRNVEEVKNDAPLPTASAPTVLAAAVQANSPNSIFPQNIAPFPLMNRPRTAISWTVGSDAAVEASVAADLESHRIGRNRVVADLPMLDIRLVVNGQRHMFASAHPLHLNIPSTTTTGPGSNAKPLPYSPSQQQHQDIKFHSYHDAEKAACDDAEAFHFTEEQKARRLIDLCVGDNSMLDKTSVDKTKASDKTSFDKVINETLVDKASDKTSVDKESDEASVDKARDITSVDRASEEKTPPLPLAEALMVVESVQNAIEGAYCDEVAIRNEEQLSSNEVDLQNALSDHDDLKVSESATLEDREGDTMALADG